MTATSSCASLLVQATRTSGIIESNQRPDYSDNLDCQWNISSNTMLELAFTRFRTQASSDYVRVYNGGSSSSPLIDSFSGSSLPSPVSSSGKLYVKFTSDSSSNTAGFRARYRGRLHV